MKHFLSTAAIAMILAITANAATDAAPSPTPKAKPKAAAKAAATPAPTAKPKAAVKAKAAPQVECKSFTVLAPVYGTGFYLGVQGGFNAFQDTPSSARIDYPGFVTDTYSTNSKIGGFAGLKAGYVFGTAKIRPAVEFDTFYNGFSQDIVIRERGVYNGDYLAAKVNVDSAAYLANAIVRFDFGRFQHYVGAGIGGYTAETTLNAFYHVSNSSWAWQIIAGTDYYITPTVSVFVEYKFLNYMDSASIGGPIQSLDRVGQQLAGMGLRFHF